MSLLGKLLDVPGKIAGAAAETVTSLPGVAADAAHQTIEGTAKGIKRSGDKMAGKKDEE